MVSTGIGSKDLPIEHVRHPSHGMPIARVPGCQRPMNTFQVDPMLNLRVSNDVIRIVVINEIEPVYWPKNNGYDGCEYEIDCPGVDLTPRRSPRLWRNPYTRRLFSFYTHED